MTSRGAVIRIAALAVALTPTLAARCDQITEPPSPAEKTKGVTNVTFSPRDSSVADGSSTVSVTVELDALNKPATNQITVTTTAGTLSPAGAPVTLSANDSGFAYAQLRAPTDTVTAALTFSSSGLTYIKHFKFYPAPPDRVLLSVSSLGVKAGPLNSIAVSASVLRNIGAPSPGAKVTFSADAGRGTSGDFGSFSPKSVITGASNSVTANFTAGTTMYTGPVTIRALVTRGDSTVRDSVVIQVVSP